VIILLLNGWANAKLAAASNTAAIKHRAAVFMFENTCSFRRGQLQMGFTKPRRHSTVSGEEFAQKLFDLRENAFHLFPAEGPQRMMFDIAQCADFKHERAHRFVIWRLE